MDRLLYCLREWWLFLLIGVVIVLFIAMVIIASIPQLTEGIVTDMKFTPAHTVTDNQIKTDSEGNTYSVPTIRHYPDSWSIQVEGYNKKDEKHAEWWDIGGGLYEQVHLGDRVQRDPDTGVIRKVGLYD